MGKALRRAVSRLAVAALCATALHFGAITAEPQSFRNPVVLSIAPDVVNCDAPDDPDNVEDVVITGICFLDDITSGFLSLSPDGSGPQVPLTNVVNIGRNVVSATVPLEQLTQRGAPYYVFLVRGTDGKRSTSYPNAFGFDVTFSCASEVIVDGPVLTSCRVVRTTAGGLVLQVNGVGFRPNDTIVLLDGQPCRRNRYPQRFINPSDGTTTRVHCSGGLDGLLPAVVTTRSQSTGLTSMNSLICDRR